MRVLLIAAGALVGALVQAQNDRPTFDVASIKPNNSGTTIANGGGARGNRFGATNATLIQLLRTAYGVQEFQIEGEPGWAGVDRFDIVATIPTERRPEEWPAMLQNLLAARFRLKLHRDIRQINGYALLVANGGLKISPVDTSRCTPPNGSCGFNATPTEIVARGMSMDQLATRLSRSIGQTVVNRTGVSGIFDYRVQWTQDDQFREPGASASPAIFTALTEQLGLRLQSQRVPIEVLVIDGVDRPTSD